MWLTLAGLFLLAWIILMLAKVTFAAIHVLLIVAVVALAIHFFRRMAPRGGAVP